MFCLQKFCHSNRCTLRSFQRPCVVFKNTLCFFIKAAAFRIWAISFPSPFRHYAQGLLRPPTMPELTSHHCKREISQILYTCSGKTMCKCGLIVHVCKSPHKPDEDTKFSSSNIRDEIFRVRGKLDPLTSSQPLCLWVIDNRHSSPTEQ